MRTADDRREALVRGAQAEDFVSRVLTTQGWQVLARNWRGAGGEIDVVVSRDGAVRLVEVKAREAGTDAGLDAITYSKQRRLVRAARAWIQQHEGSFDEVCFLLALVDLAADPVVIEWLDNPFDGA